MNDDRRATGVALLGLCCLCASGCEEPGWRQSPAHELPLATSRHIDFLQPSADRERLFFLTDIDTKKESATLDVVSADGVFTPLAALVYQPALRDTGEMSPWWDERPLHPREGAPAFQVSRDGSRALALLQRYGREARLLAVFDAESGGMTKVAAGVEREGYQLDADAGVYFAAGADTLYHVAEPGQERVEIARGLSPVGMLSSPSGRLVALSEGCSSEIPPQCRLALAHADGSPPRILSDKAGEQFREVVFDAREERVLFPDGVRYIYGTNRVPATIVSAPIEPSAKVGAVQLAVDAQLDSARFSPDGRWVTLLAQPSEDWADPGPVMGSLQLVPAVGGVPQTLAPVALAESHFSPDGRRLYFLSEPHRGVATLQMVALPAGSRAAVDPEPVKIAGQVAGLRESPGGSRLLFLSGFRAGKGTLELLSLPSGKVLQLGHDVILGSYRFSRDGGIVYWAASTRASQSGPPDPTLRGGPPLGAADGARLYAAAAPDFAPVLLAAGLLEQKYFLSPDGRAVLSFPREAPGPKPELDASAVLSFLDGTRVNLARGLPRLWSMANEPEFSPSGKLVAFFTSSRGDAYLGQGAGTLEVARVPDGQIVGRLDDVRTFAWLAGDRLDAVVHGREESLVAVPLVP